MFKPRLIIKQQQQKNLAYLGEENCETVFKVSKWKQQSSAELQQLYMIVHSHLQDIFLKSWWEHEKRPYFVCGTGIQSS